MNDSLLVQVSNSRDELSKQLGSILLLEVAMSEDVVEQLSACANSSESAQARLRREGKSRTGCILEDDTDVLFRLDDIVQSNNVGVSDNLHIAKTRVSQFPRSLTFSTARELTHLEHLNLPPNLLPSLRRINIPPLNQLDRNIFSPSLGMNSQFHLPKLSFSQRLQQDVRTEIDLLSRHLMRCVETWVRSC